MLTWLFLTACSFAPAPSPPPAARLPWLEGTWAQAEDRVVTEERWARLPDGSLLSVGRRHAPARTPEERDVLLFAEALHIADSAEGDLVLTAWPAGQDPVRYTAVDQDGSSVRFANPDHDFPAVITYALLDPATLDITAEGTRAGEPAKVAFRLSRVP
jgi:hypothetical protein